MAIMDIFNFGLKVNKIVEQEMAAYAKLNYEYVSDCAGWHDMQYCPAKIKRINIWQTSKYKRYSNNKCIKIIKDSMGFALRCIKGHDPNTDGTSFKFKNLSEIADSDPFLTKRNFFVSGKKPKENDWWGADVPELYKNPESGHEKLIKEAAEIVIKNIRLLAIN